MQYVLSVYASLLVMHYPLCFGLASWLLVAPFSSLKDRSRFLSLRISDRVERVQSLTGIRWGSSLRSSSSSS
jgi:hypothetical protein